MLAGPCGILAGIRKKFWLFLLPFFLIRLLDSSLLVQSAKEGCLYFSVGTVFQIASQGTRIGSALCRFSGSKTLADEFLFVSRICDVCVKRAWGQLIKPSRFGPDGPHSLDSWRLNQKLLSEIPVQCSEARQLVQFLEQRWLAKANGYYPSMIDWVFPCFDILIQMHPDTAPTYARDPSTACSKIYANRINAWKQSLALSHDDPLILTRPGDLHEYLPSYLRHEKEEAIGDFLPKIRKGSKAFVDFTSIFPSDSKSWDFVWEGVRSGFLEACKKRGLDPEQIFCLHRIEEGDLGGLRLLFLERKETAEKQHRFLLEWISRLGFSATQVELDRQPAETKVSVKEAFATLGTLIHPPSKELFVSDLCGFEKDWRTESPEKKLMLEGAMQVLKGLFDSLPQKRWDEAVRCPTRIGIIKLVFSNIRCELEKLKKEGEALSIFDFITHVERIQMQFSQLLEVLSPFEGGDFNAVYRDLLTSVPKNLKSLTSCAVHATAMASLAGLYKAVEKTLGMPPEILYGENAYFENIITAKWVSKAHSVEEMKEEDWGRIDLFLAQFNPALKRVGLDPIAYKVEKIGPMLKKILAARKGKPVTLAVDCTIDFINSSRLSNLFEEFQNEILEGTLNVAVYRSGLKYDLFGMDHFAGAPFYMIHNSDPKWSSFDSLISDPALQTDRLSLNWFCLAYKYASAQLESYRKTIFDNTRALLRRIPPCLYNEKACYRVVEMQEDADPGFIDARIFGPFHRLKGASIVIASLFIKTMEEGHPIFTRRSIGFSHPNVSILFGERCSTIRLTVGLDPGQIEVLARCFDEIGKLNPFEEP